MTSALEGIRVIDWSTSVAGGWCSRLLADFGADVIVLEARTGHPLRTREDADELFVNKRAVALDIESQRGRRIAVDLVRRSDILVSSASEVVLTALGVAYPMLRRPVLIMGHVPDGAARPVEGARLTGLVAATGILAALRHRDEHPGEGQELAVDPDALLAGVTVGTRAAGAVGAPFALSATPWGVLRPAPARPGEHSFDVLRHVAGITDDHLLSYYEAGVIGVVEA
jgi:crotonobetainyl-CoA:carnitine CoA-transferase CaiB-like acyl-CoA transferase